MWGLRYRVDGVGFRVSVRASGLGSGLPSLAPSRERMTRNVKWFRRGLVFKAHRLLYHSTLGLRVIKKKKRMASFGGA